MRGNIDYVLFAVRDYYNDKVSFNNDTIQFDPTFEPARHVTIHGEVAQAPYRLSNKPIMIIKEHLGFPGYGAIQGAPNDYMADNLDALYAVEAPRVHRLHDIAMEVRPGDTIYFHYNTLLREDNFVADSLLGMNGVDFDLWKVRYDQIFCAMRPRKKKKQGKEIIMIGSWCLIEPDMESWDDIVRPTYYNILDPMTGKKKLRPKEEWLQLKTKPEKQYLKGTLKHVGTPLKGQALELKQGDYIVYTPNADFEIKVENKTYFAIRQNHIEGVIEREEKPILTVV